VGEPDIVEKVKKGHRANGKRWKVHLDGFNFLPFFKGEAEKGPREQIYYFSAEGDLNAIRWKDWKLHFALMEGDNIADAVRMVVGWPKIINLRADPYEQAWQESQMYLRWMGDQMWLFVPIQQQVQQFLASLEGYPFQEGQAINAAGINYQSLRTIKILKQIREKGILDYGRQ